MIQLEHINLVVSDIEQMLTFYQAAFPDWRVRGGGKGSWYGKERRWIHFGDDYQYLAMSDHGEGVVRDNTGHSVGLAHFAFVTDDLDGIVARLQDAGFEMDSQGQQDEYRRNVYFFDPGGYEVEFVEYSSDKPDLRNRY